MPLLHATPPRNVIQMSVGPNCPRSSSPRTLTTPETPIEPGDFVTSPDLISQKRRGRLSLVLELVDRDVTAQDRVYLILELKVASGTEIVQVNVCLALEDRITGPERIR